MNKKRGFTLVELLAVIVILAVILVIAVPSIISTITESRKGALVSSAKLIASSAETKKVSNDTLGIEEEITCEMVSKFNREDYDNCILKFDESGKAQVTIVGKGKFEGMRVCSGTKENAVVIESNKCSVQTVSFNVDSWETIKAAVTAGDTENYNVGDTKEIDLGTLGTHIVRIANKTPCDGTLESQTACGFVIEFADIITSHVMNLSCTNVGGWKDSNMRTYVNETIYNAIPKELRDGIILTRVVSSHGDGDKKGTLENGNFESEDYLYLLSTREVYGKEGTSNIISGDSADGDSITRQLDWYNYNKVTTSSYNILRKNMNINGIIISWILRSASSSSDCSFYSIDSSGKWFTSIPHAKSGVSPAFRLG